MQNFLLKKFSKRKGRGVSSGSTKVAQEGTVRGHMLKTLLFVSFLTLFPPVWKYRCLKLVQEWRLPMTSLILGEAGLLLPLAESPNMIFKVYSQTSGTGKYWQHLAVCWLEYVKSCRGAISFHCGINIIYSGWHSVPDFVSFPPFLHPIYIHLKEKSFEKQVSHDLSIYEQTVTLLRTQDTSFLGIAHSYLCNKT